MFKINKINFIILILIFIELTAAAQCSSVISTFPYFQDFETAPSWTSGGTNSDWAWGTPAHPTINTAGGGTKSWMVGTLTGSFYNYSELSWLESPCFDFSTLNYPWISFKIFWEDEWKYDGMVLQYSLNAGSTWTNVGAFGDPVDCLNDNWYDYGNITWLTSATPKNGWTGRTGATVGSCQGGNGSLGWVNAKHCMSALANLPSVKFRFLFGAGTTCNNYDGIAIDDILIDNAPPNAANFTYACAGANTVSFTNTSAMCPTGYLWDFGDGTTSSVQSPSHTYSAPGTYNVMLTASGPCNASNSITIPVSILGVTTTVTNITCNGANDGTAMATVTGSTGTVNYLWTPGGQTTLSISSLSAATYTVSVSASGSCSATATAIITQPAVLNASTAVTPVSCFGGNNGTTTVTATGGTSPYTYSWAGGGTSATNSALAAGIYNVTVTDVNNCTTSATSIITQPASALSVSATSTPSGCSASGTATAIAMGGTAPYTYSWSPSGGSAALATALSAATYTVSVTDNNLCTSTATTTVTSSGAGPSLTVTSTNVSCFGGNNGAATAVTSGGTPPYSYSWSPSGGSSAVASGLTANTYTVSVTDAGGGCTATAMVTISQPSSALSASVSNTPAICTTNNGTATVSPSGGTSPYTYSWLPSGGTGTNASSLSAGTYTVTVTDAHSCTTSATTMVIDTGSIITSISFSSITCFGQANGSVLASSQNGTGPYSYLWNTGATSPALNNLSAGEYSVTATDNNGCVDSAYVILYNPPPMTADFTANPFTASMINPEISFYTNAPSAVNWQWNFGDGSTAITENPTHDYPAEGTYPVTMIATNDLGCTDTVTHFVIIDGGYTFYAPNAITPNQDGTNDTFLPKGTGWDNSTFELYIYDRWGELIYFTNETAKGWDGTTKNGSNIAPNGVYVWKVNLSDKGGNTHNYNGSVTVIN
jgi:gliding motility-associated-like protein